MDGTKTKTSATTVNEHPTGRSEILCPVCGKPFTGFFRSVDATMFCDRCRWVSEVRIVPQRQVPKAGQEAV